MAFVDTTSLLYSLQLWNQMNALWMQSFPLQPWQPGACYYKEEEEVSL